MAKPQIKKIPDDDTKDDALEPTDAALDGDIEDEEEDEDLDSWELEEDLEE
ncbi:MAG: hypothetical protein Q7S12_02665 [bacterium]|nr:hypothetical protein [bacterium]